MNIVSNGCHGVVHVCYMNISIRAPRRHEGRMFGHEYFLRGFGKTKSIGLSRLSQSRTTADDREYCG